jgi:methionyl-tRNA formyltransferase
MKIIFFGTSEFAIAPLRALIRSEHDISFVVTQPKKERGRGLKLLPTDVEAYSQKEGIEVSACKDVNSKEFIERLKRSKADIFIVVDFGQILSDELLNIPRLFSLNIHASLLPKYRGAAPIQRAILDGEKETGITIMKITRLLDSGDIIAQMKVGIESNDDSATLRRKLSKLGAELLTRTLKRIDNGDVTFIKQDESKATYAAKIKKEDGLIIWVSSAKRIINQIHACNPWPSAYTYFEGKLLKVLKAEVLGKDKAAKPGSVIGAEKDKIIIACKDAYISIIELQLEGKKPLSAAEFLRGYPLPEGRLLG